MNNAQDQTRIGSTTGTTAEPQAPERNASVDSAAFFEGGDYDDYDDFAAGGNGGGGGGKVNKRSNERGGGGSGTIYSAKHIRAKEALQSSTAGRNNKTTSTSKK